MNPNYLVFQLFKTKSDLSETGLLHLSTDEACTANPEYRKQLEFLQNSALKKKKKEEKKKKAACSKGR